MTCTLCIPRICARMLALVLAVAAGSSAWPAVASGYLTSEGTGETHALVATLTAPAYAEAEAVEAGVRITWRPSMVGSSYASSYAVGRYSSTGEYLGAATCGEILAPEPESAETLLECIDEPSAGTFEYEITGKYKSWSTRSPATEAVTVRTSTTSLQSSSNPVMPNVAVSYVATVEAAPAGSAGGVVRFSDGGVTIEGCAEVPLSATSPQNASCRIQYASAGSHVIIAEYLGDGSYPSSESPALSEEVLKGEQTITFAELPSRHLGESATANATASSGLPVIFRSTSSGICSIAGEAITLEATGTCTIEARQEGDEEWNAAIPVSRSFTIDNPPAGPLTALSPAAVLSGSGPARVVVSPDGKDVYATNRFEGTISQYSRDGETGALSPLSSPTVTSGSKPEGIAVTPNGAYAYVANLGSNTVSEYARNQTTGELTPLSPASVAAENQPIGIAVSPNGENVYVVESESEEVTTYSVNGETGQLTILTSGTLKAEANAHGVVVSPDGSSVYVSNYGSGTVSMYSVGTGGALTSLGTVAAGTNPHDLAISSDGKNVYVTDSAEQGEVRAFSRNVETGALTADGSSTAGMYTECAIVSPDGEEVYATNEVSGTVSQYARDAEGGLLAPLSPAYVSSGERPEGIAISPDGKDVYVADRGSDSISQYKR